MNPYRDKLISLAHRYGDELQQRPEALGLALYGSLACAHPDDITPFSDIDYALVRVGPMPSYFVEHRVVEGVRADVLFFRADDVEDLAVHPPHSLWERGWVMHYLLTSLTLAGSEALLFDPSGLLARVTEALDQATSYAQLALPDASEWFHAAIGEELEPAVRLLEDGDFPGAVRAAGRTAGRLGDVLGFLTVRKDRRAAAEKLGIPGFHRAAAHLEEFSTPRGGEDVWQAAQALWEHALRTAYDPVREALAQAGVTEPDHLDLIGDYGVFWGGPRIHEIGRVIADVNLSLAWSRAELDSGHTAMALNRLWPVRESGATIERWKRLDTALRGTGFDLSGVIQRFLDDTKTRRLATDLDRANEAATPPPAGRPEAAEAVRLAGEMRDLLAGAFPLLPPVELYQQKARWARRSTQLAEALARLEAAAGERGEPAGFIAFCEQQRQAVGRVDARDPSGPAALQQWYLRPETLPQPAGTAQPIGRDAVWQWLDGGGDSSYEHLPSGETVVRMKSWCYFADRAIRVPALLRELHGDFSLEAVVVGTGGLLVRQDDSRYLHLERHGYLDEEVWFAVRSGTVEEPVEAVIGRGRLPTPRLRLRISRQGHTFRASCAANGGQWFGCGTVELPLGDPVLAGVFGLFIRSGADTVRFSDLRLWRERSSKA